MAQFGGALAELNLEILCANSSQAKGRVERAFAVSRMPCRPAPVLQSPIRCPVRLSSVRITLSRKEEAASISFCISVRSRRFGTYREFCGENRHAAWFVAGSHDQPSRDAVPGQAASLTQGSHDRTIVRCHPLY
jgi:hypothetical protein